MSHTCHAHGCDKRVQPRMLFCLPHWRMVRPELQRAVWREYRDGQEIRKNPTARYMVIQRLAVAEVAAGMADAGLRAEAHKYKLEMIRWREEAMRRGEGCPLTGLVRNEEIDMLTEEFRRT